MTRTETLRALKARQAAKQRNAKALLQAAKAHNPALVAQIAARECAQAAAFKTAIRG